MTCGRSAKTEQKSEQIIPFAEIPLQPYNTQMVRCNVSKKKKEKTHTVRHDVHVYVYIHSAYSLLKPLLLEIQHRVIEFPFYSPKHTSEIYLVPWRQCGCNQTDSIIRNETAINCVKEMGVVQMWCSSGGILSNLLLLLFFFQFLLSPTDKIRSYLLQYNEFSEHVSGKTETFALDRRVLLTIHANTVAFTHTKFQFTFVEK